MKRFVQGDARDQITLLPDCVDDYVDENNPVRVVDVFVDELDFRAMGFEGTKHNEFVFVSRKTKQPLKCINNTPFQNARAAAGLDRCRVHDLKHTFGERLEAAGVARELKQILLGHRNDNITTHYSMPRIQELMVAAEKVVDVKGSPSVVRVIGGVAAKASPPIFPQGKTKATTKVA